MGNCYGGSSVPGAYSYGTGVPMAGAIDADPITPGIQSTPGVVTPVGPPQVVGGQGFGAIGTPYQGGIGVQSVGMPQVGVPQVSVPQVGFQQTSFQTTTSTPFVQGGFRPPFAGGVGGFPGSGITPGVSIGAPGVIGGGPFIPQNNFGRIGAGIDMDPISPGIQTRPGVVTATGPTRFAW